MTDFVSTESQKSRNLGLVGVGALATLVLWQWAGVFAVAVSPFPGVATYANDVFNKNSPSKLDPVFTLIGGFAVALIQYARHVL